jgi:mRNA interferase RelE/StbE
MSYQLSYLPSASKSIQSISRQMQRRVLARLERLAVNPRAPGCEKLAGKDEYRVRVGDYRIIYTIHDEKLIVIVIDVGHRREVYRRK